MSIQVDPHADFGGAQSALALKNLRLRSQTGEKLSFTDGDGRAFNLTISRSTEVNYSLYTRSSRLAGAGGPPEMTPRKSAEELQEALGVELASDPTLQRAIERYRQLVEGQFFGNHYGRFQPRPPLADNRESFERVELLEISQTVTIEMDAVDTEYWSAENTAKRLVDFALSLFAGGDRLAHAGKMLAGLEQGFEEAEEAFGGWLPEISSRTIEMAKEDLAEWAKEGFEPTEGENAAA